ncbi:hypothetical protein F5Y13DRAFT_159697 [Hypoxylon sp. FL1857]|nr:hypothetical protein F5Y13DRAFT_159697 [Hypoxylon sp. FL1857]
METTVEEKDPFSFEIQLNTEEELREFHRYNDGDEVQRPDVIDDCCLDLLLMARIDRIVHGSENIDGSPATLVVFGFRFHGINEMRRFKQAIITITFQDEQKRYGADPEVIAMWPNGDFTLGEPTSVAVEQTTGREIGGEVKGGQVVEGAAHVTRSWQRKMSFTKTDRSTLTGSIILDTNIRKSGKSNAVRMTISENTTTRSGIVTDFRAAVLLRRKNDVDHFLATVKIKAKANFLYNAIKGLRDISGLSPGNDPVKFVPGQQYLRQATLAGFLEAKLMEDIDENNLNAARLDGLAGVLGTTVISTSI